MIKLLRTHWPCFVALIMLWGSVGIVAAIAGSHNQGHLTYAVDDAYIHMAISKNFSQHGVWGVTPYAFTSASSSLLWEILLAAVFFVTGPNDLVPLALNVLFSTLAVVLSYAILWRAQIPAIFTACALVALTFLTSLPALVFTGMEHNLQLVLLIVFIYVAALTLALPRDAPITRRRLLALCGLALLATGVRYESMAVILIVCGLLLVRRGFRRGGPYALLVAAAASLPIVVYGLISVANGWYFLPNSVWIKSAQFNLSTPFGLAAFLGLRGLSFVLVHRFLLSLILVNGILLYPKLRCRELWTPSALFGLITLGVIVFHVQFAQVGSYYRYEAYLITLSVVSVSLLLHEVLGSSAIRGFERNAKHLTALAVGVVAVAFILTLIVGPLIERANVALLNTPQAMTNIYEQQYQMGLFLKTYYEGQPVVASDIGAIDYLADIRLTDLAGLGTLEVGREFHEHNAPALTTQQADEISKANRARIGIVFDGLLLTMPSSWQRVGEWQISNDIIAASDTVSFYAIDPANVESLKANLRQFSSRLPTTVKQMGDYLPDH